MKKNKQGGERPGAGRKRKYKCATITKSYRMPFDDSEEIDKKILGILKTYQIK